jgi:hypothetical protein
MRAAPAESPVRVIYANFEWSERKKEWKLTDSAGRDLRRCSAASTVCPTWLGYGDVGERPGTLALSP